MRKSPGPGDIKPEMIVAAGGRGVTEITNLANMRAVSQSICIHPYLFQYQR